MSLAQYLPRFSIFPFGYSESLTMSLSARKARKDLSADSLFRLVRSRFKRLADPRSADVDIPLGDALMSAFAMFSLKDPSLLAFVL